MRDNLAQPQGPEGNTVDAIEMVDRLLIIASLGLRVRLPVASSVSSSSGVGYPQKARYFNAIVRLQSRKLAFRAVQGGLALLQMIESLLNHRDVFGPVPMRR